MAAAVAPPVTPRGGARPTVYWLGMMPAELGAELSRRNLVPKSGDLYQILHECQAGTRSVLVPFDPGMRKDLAELYFPVLDRGASLSVVLSDPGSRASASEIISSLKRETVKGMGGGALTARVSTLNGWNFPEVAEACASHIPGRDANESLVVVSDPAPDSSHVLLLKRAFNDFLRISLTLLPGGFSGTTVWSAEAVRVDGVRCEPFVVKAGDRQTIKTEIETMRDQVLDYLGFPHRPPMLPDRSVEGATQQLIVSMFIQAAVRFDLFVRDTDATSVVTELFCTALAGWRTQRRQTTIKLGQEYARYGVLGGKDALEPAYALAKAMPSAGPRPPSQLLAALNRLPPLSVMVCHAHGDLHMRNVFVRRTSDVVVIDFSAANYDSPVARDLGTLDVSLALDTIKGIALIPDSVLVDWYAAPLFKVRASGGDNRLSAIAKIRTQAQKDGASERDYSVAVIAYLLRFSRFDPESTDPDRRGLAYNLADSLLPSTFSA